MSVASPYAARLGQIPVERHEVQVLEATTRYWAYGPPMDVPNVPTIVAVHGFRGEHHGLESIVAYLPGVRVISPDLPGFGATPPIPEREHDLGLYSGWLSEFTRAIAPGAVILGHSFGSIVASAAVASGLETPQLILVNPIGAPALEGPKGLLTRLAMFYYAMGARLPETLGTAVLRSPLIVRAASLAMVTASDPALRRFIHDQHDTYFSRFADREVLQEAFATSVSHDVRAFAGVIDAPTLLIAAQRDQITPIEAERDLVSMFPEAELVEIADVGHLIHYEAPAEAAGAIRRFLRIPVAPAR